MHTKKSALSTAVVLAMGGVSYSANAALITGTTLSIDSGSQFTMGTPAGIVTTAMTTGLQGGLIIGQTQNVAPSHPTHGGAPHTNKGKLDREWLFFTNTGVHFTETAVTVDSDGGATKTLDFSGWRVSWNGIASINMGGGIQDCGTTDDALCGSVGGTFDNGTGIATITCSTSSCSNTSNYTLTYSATVPQADPSGFGGAPYGLTMTGTVSAIPVPAAVWLFGSGLLGLVGVARRKKS